MASSGRSTDGLLKEASWTGIAIPLGIFLFALLLRFLYVFQVHDWALSSCLTLDQAYYNNWALKIAGGDWLGDKVFEMTPFYAYFLAFIYKFISRDLFVVKLIQIVIGSIGCVLVYRITKDLLESRTMSALAGLTAAAYGPFILYDAMIMKPFLAVFFVLLMTFFLLKSRGGLLRYPLLAGIFLALVALNRENIILLIPVIPVWFLVSRGDGPMRLGLWRAAFFLAGIVLIILPVTMRNLYVGSQFVLITSGGGENFFIGNNPDADGTYVEPDFVRPNPRFEHEDFRQRAMELTGRELSRKESSDFWYSEGFKFIFENPLGYARLLKKKMVFFWNFYEFPDNQNYYFQRTLSSVLGGPLVHFGVIAPLGLIGIFLSLGRFTTFAVPNIVFITYLASFMIFFNLARYRLPAVPFLIVFGIYAVSWIVKNLLKKRLRPLFLCLPILAILYAGVNYNVFGKDPYRHEFDTAYANMGHCYAEVGRAEDAYALYKKSLEITPNYPGALAGVGTFYYQRGRIDLAEKAYRDAIEANTYFSMGHYGLGTVFLVSGELDSALHELKRAVELDPWRADYRVNLGFVLNAKGRYAEALDVFKEAVRMKPDFATAYYGLAIVYENSRQYEEAIASWATLLDLGDQGNLGEKAEKSLERLRGVVGGEIEGAISGDKGVVIPRAP